MDLQLTDKVVIITGASSGIGRATALLVAAEGGIPVLVARSADKLAKAKAEIEGAGGVADVHVADVGDPATPDRVIATVLEQHGRIDALVNNAGGLQARTGFLDITDEQWLATFNLNFHAARRMSRAAVPAMLKSGGGSLVHVGSDSARLPDVGNQDYAAAKLSLLALSTSLATEFSPQGIRSNVVVPLDQGPGRGGREEFARLHRRLADGVRRASQGGRAFAFVSPGVGAIECAECPFGSAQATREPEAIEGRPEQA
jgi:NAD(P)-dependent dehydrogenase (short-subunit alcohol dehydrogenase family)